MARQYFIFKLILLVGSVLFCSSFINAQEIIKSFTINGTEVRDLKSQINGVEYELNINLPYSYKTDPTKKYPVVYFCDGFYDFPLFTAIYGSGVYDKTIGECFLVGFTYKGEHPDFEKLRTHDYTPTVDTSQGSTGGAHEFLEVVEKDFIPFMEANYRVDTTFRALGGSSKGGLFTLYAMFSKPYLFDAYMAISPSTDWDNNYLFKVEEEFYKNNKELPVSLFMSVAEFDLPMYPRFMKSIKDFNEVLSKRDYKNFRYKFRFVDDAHHSGTKPESYTRAMKFIFQPLLNKN